MVRKPNNDRFPDFIKLKFKEDRGRVTARVFNSSKEDVGLEYVTKNCQVGALMEL